MIVMELMSMMTVELVEYFDYVCVGVGPAESIASSIEAENELVWLLGRFINSSNHSRCDMQV